MIPLPDPPLVWEELRLRPWQVEDAPALVAAWADPEIHRWTAVPERRDLVAARRWIAGDEVRRSRCLSLDLVVERSAQVAGEIGLSSFDREVGTAEIGWWTAADHRGRGVATAAATLVVEWATSHLGLDRLVARCHPDNAVAIAVARKAGAMVLS